MRCHFHEGVERLPPPDPPGREDNQGYVLTDSILHLDDVSISYAKPGFIDQILGRQPDVTPTVDDIVLDIARGETVGLVGESGSGKSTILSAVAGLWPPPAGHDDVRRRQEPRYARRSARPGSAQTRPARLPEPGRLAQSASHRRRAARPAVAALLRASRRRIARSQHRPPGTRAPRRPLPQPFAEPVVGRREAARRRRQGVCRRTGARALRRGQPPRSMSRFRP